MSISKEQFNIDLNKLEADLDPFLYNHSDNVCTVTEQRMYPVIFLLLEEQLLF